MEALGLMKKICAAVVLILGLTGYSGVWAADTDMKQDEAKAIQAAMEYVNSHLPREREKLNLYEPFVLDEGNYWGVSFQPPGQLTTGGVPEFKIEKGNYKIIEVRRAQ